MPHAAVETASEEGGSSHEPPSEDGCSRSEACPEDYPSNLAAESAFSAFNGVFMGMIFFGGPVIGYACLGATPLHLTIMTAAFPCGAFLGPLWAAIGRRWGMKQLVLQMAVLANVPLFLMPFVDDAATFTAIITLAQLVHSGMRLGMSSAYRLTYPKPLLGRAIGYLTFWQFCTMVPTVLLAGWLSDGNPGAYRWLFPLAAFSGLLGCQFYARLRIPRHGRLAVAAKSLRSGLQDAREVLTRDRGFLLLEAGFFLCGGAFFMSNHVTIMLSHDRLGFSAGELAFWLTVMPQLALVATSLLWGRVLDQLGMSHARLVVGIFMTLYLACYFLGIVMGLPWLICLGSLLRGTSEGGGQVTWATASVHFAPRAQDVPLYNGIHFVLNGVRGLIMPCVGSLLALLTGQWTIFLATLVAACSVYVGSQALRVLPRGTGDEADGESAKSEPLVQLG